MNTLVKKLRKTFPLKRDKAQKDCKISKSEGEDAIKKESLQESSETKEDTELVEDDDSDFEMNSRKLKQKLRKMAKKSLPQINIDEYVKTELVAKEMKRGVPDMNIRISKRVDFLAKK